MESRFADFSVILGICACLVGAVFLLIEYYFPEFFNAAPFVKSIKFFDNYFVSSTVGEYHIRKSIRKYTSISKILETQDCFIV